MARFETLKTSAIMKLMNSMALKYNNYSNVLLEIHVTK